MLEELELHRPSFDQNRPVLLGYTSLMTIRPLIWQTYKLAAALPQIRSADLKTKSQIKISSSKQ